jgi:NADPH2:quinone reductase
MRAQQQQNLDGPAGLRLVELAPPSDETKVLIAVRAAGVSFPELLHTYGRYQERPELPFIPGSEVAGVVKRAPSGSGLQPGDRVVAASWFGGWAEEVATDPHVTFALPAGLDFAEGAALMVNYQTAHFSLCERGRLRDGEYMLVNGAAGGLGTACIQVGRGIGAHVIALVSSESKAATALAAGAHAAILTDDGWKARVNEQTDGRGVDVFIDIVGGSEAFVDGLRCLAVQGRAIVAGFAGGEIPEVRVNRLLLNNTEIIGAAWGPFVRVDPSQPRRAYAALATMVSAGTVRPAVGHRFALDDAVQALRTLESRAAQGKVILEL